VGYEHGFVFASQYGIGFVGGSFVGTVGWLQNSNRGKKLNDNMNKKQKICFWVGAIAYLLFAGAPHRMFAEDSPLTVTLYMSILLTRLGIVVGVTGGVIYILRDKKLKYKEKQIELGKGEKTRKKQIKSFVARVLITCIVILFFLIAYFCIWVLPFFFLTPFDDMQFNAEVWARQAGTKDYKNPRGQMYEDLLENHLHRGITKDQVIQLLGEPDYSKSDTLLRYYLGHWSEIGRYPDYLYVEFDAKGRLKRAYKVQR
jgi:hypothetical protein